MKDVVFLELRGKSNEAKTELFNLIWKLLGDEEIERVYNCEKPHQMIVTLPDSICPCCKQRKVRT